MPSEQVPPPSSDSRMTTPPLGPILIVDDEPVILEMLCDVLAEEGFEVITARDGRAALALLQQTTVVLVLMDFMMPHMDGIELAEALRRDRRTAAIPLVLMTAVTLPRVTTPFVAVLRKPFALDKLVRLVRQFGPG